ncbi:mitochondrial ribosomal protein L37-domain-containing protein [Sphaerosporella brunnea]|uniref:Large ribosomal subunit protein mL54 n=1 Tax=Sphaerosporella brunnea TaxID=1250544 RepID=A0A5J5FCU6_9PEZI|nr:mitochondrial ribosomal protein L37-domain-containing protein [Sphaerosporella brunnea]
MLCARCVARAPITRTLFAAAKRTYADDASPNPLTTPLTPGPRKISANAVRSSVPPGTRLFNINYFKNKADPIALEDGEYPAWLWSSLESSKDAAEDDDDFYSNSKKARLLAKKRAATLAAMTAINPEKNIPIHEQTIDRPFATVSDPPMGPMSWRLLPGLSPPPEAL